MVDHWTRRRFVAVTSRVAGIGAAGLSVPLAAPSRDANRIERPTQERFPVVAAEPWGRILAVSEGVWALESTPLEHRATLCNGGIIAGRAGVVIVEAFGSDEGARWMVRQAEELTGRPPTHVVLTHYHGDHTNGLRALAEDASVEVLATRATLDRVPGRPGDPDGSAAATFRIVREGRPTELDLGDRSVLLVPRRGHTRSDLTVEIFDASVVFCGDLVWSGMFPNYVDARPGRLSRAVRVLGARRAHVYVSGHGVVVDGAGLERYLRLLDHVERYAREAMDRGRTPAEAGATYRLPDELADWTLFNPQYFERAIAAWFREIQG